MKNQRKKWLLALMGSAFILLIGIIFTVYQGIYWEHQAKARYRSIKSEMRDNFYDNPEGFSEIWAFSKQLPKLDYINFLDDEKVVIQIDRKTASFPGPSRYWSRVEMDPLALISLTANANPASYKSRKRDFHIGHSGNDSLYQGEVGEKEIKVYAPGIDTSMVLDDNYFLEYKGGLSSPDIENVLTLAGVTTNQFLRLKKLLKNNGITAGFRKDDAGNIYLGYWDGPGTGAFEYVIPFDQFCWAEGIFEAGIIDQGLGVFWQFGSRPVQKAIFCSNRPLIIIN